jgi:6-pyruvoyltetrahydropterin/6-carboxytetrahydropterin synthase
MAYFILEVKQQFSAARALRDYVGKCSHLHGHNFQVKVGIKTPEVDKGYSLDFYDIKRYLTEILEPFHLGYINDVAPFTEQNPTNENLAKFIFQALLPYLNNETAELLSVTVCEDADCAATYYPCP